MIAQIVKGNARGSGYARKTHDYYCEPAWSVDALLDVETFTGYTHDPACGSGNIPECFKARGLDAGGSDIVDRGYGAQKDFLDPMWLHVDKTIANIVCNPPFGDATDFLLKSLQVATDKVCILQRLAWLEGKARRKIFEATPLARVWVFSSRVSMPPGGSEQPAKGGSTAYAWFVWQHGHRGPPTLGWLP